MVIKFIAAILSFCVLVIYIQNLYLTFVLHKTNKQVAGMRKKLEGALPSYDEFLAYTWEMQAQTNITKEEWIRIELEYDKVYDVHLNLWTEWEKTGAHSLAELKRIGKLPLNGILWADSEARELCTATISVYRDVIHIMTDKMVLIDSHMDVIRLNMRNSSKASKSNESNEEKIKNELN